MMSFTDGNHEFSEPWNFSDAVLVVEGEKFHVHRSILSMCSPVFKRMFHSGFKESSQTEIPLPSKKADKIYELLCAVYPFPSQFSAEDTDMRSLLELAREYQIHKLTARCEERLLQRQSTLEHLLLAQEFSLKRLLEKCLNTLSRLQLQEIKTQAHFEDIDADNMVMLLSNHTRWLKEQHAREMRMLREQHNKEKARALEIVEALNSCWGYDKLPIRGCSCASYTKSCDTCNTILEKFIKLKCGELFETLQT